MVICISRLLIFAQEKEKALPAMRTNKTVVGSRSIMLVPQFTDIVHAYVSSLVAAVCCSAETGPALSSVRCYPLTNAVF